MIEDVERIEGATQDQKLPVGEDWADSILVIVLTLR